ncbi:hypothetical protein TNIN_113241 [Trichonephila inaurata madagascariensis]|uniref:Uncharacterized protein n=1 Tax=Trichonephila inaurata madagascariensis TaxID=2747483 RepID=A0A8X6YFY9_9ARAC|nr:hypothetical protein TNIN_113241 [Trichonephila inaurata madagascariensis]
MDFEFREFRYQVNLPVPDLPNSTISSKECRKLKNVMKRIRTVDKRYQKFESLIVKHKTGAHTEGYKSSLKRSRKTRETFGKRASL